VNPRGSGHLTVTCRAEGCPSIWYRPRHDRESASQRGGRPPRLTCRAAVAGDTDLHDRPAGPPAFQGPDRGSPRRRLAGMGSRGRRLRAPSRSAGERVGHCAAGRIRGAPGSRLRADPRISNGRRGRRRAGGRGRVGCLPRGCGRGRRGMGYGRRVGGDPASGESVNVPGLLPSCGIEHIVVPGLPGG
jgi:hypothetical protein